MKTMIKLVSLGAVVGLTGAFLIGCEDTDVVVSSSGVIVLSASPGAVHFDPEEVCTPRDPADPPPGENDADADACFVIGGEIVRFLYVTATVLDDSNRSQKGVTVSFESSTDNQPNPRSTETDESGLAKSVVKVTEVDEGTISITARSGTVTAATSLDVSIGPGDQKPTAVITVIPNGGSQVNEVVTFDGSGSLDPDSNITCYKWEVVSSNPDPNFPPVGVPWVIQGVGASGFTHIFTNEQILSVFLQVTDREVQPGSDFQCLDLSGVSGEDLRVEPDSAFDDRATVAEYELTCNNVAPTAVISGPNTIAATGTQAQPATVILDGRLSNDEGNPAWIDDYVWSCGGGTGAPTPVTPGNWISVICRYPPGTYTATLQVTDLGVNHGAPLVCQKTSEIASVNVVVTAPAP